VAAGEIDRLMVFMPPGYAKTLYASILFPTWFLAQGDRLNVIGCSYGSGLAEEISGKIQRYIRQNCSRRASSVGRPRMAESTLRPASAAVSRGTAPT
jgi:hypothetical protein